MNDLQSLELLKNQKVLVTGGSGFTGSLLVRKLIEIGANVRCIVRKSSNLAPLAGLPVKYYTGNVYDKQLTEEATKNVNYIFHVAAAFRQAKIADIEYARVHVESTKLLAKAACSSPQFKRFVHVSTMGVHGHIKEPPGNEESPYAPGDAYQVTKLEAEQWFRQFAKENKLPFSVVRPTAIYGPGDRRLLKIFKMATWPVFPILGSGKCLYHLVHVDDLTNMILLAAVTPKALNQVFLAGNKEAIALAEMARIIASEYQKPLKVLRLPVAPFFLAATICEKLCKPLGIEPPLYKRRVAFYTKDRSFETTRMRSLLNYSEKYSNQEGIRQTARWYLDNKWITLKRSLTNQTTAPKPNAANSATTDNKLIPNASNHPN